MEREPGMHPYPQEPEAGRDAAVRERAREAGQRAAEQREEIAREHREAERKGK